jgi:hypothetical protein
VQEIIAQILTEILTKTIKLENERDEERETLAELRASVLDLSHPNIKMILSERDEAREYADKLAQGLPDGMLPKDVEVLRSANLGLATELTTVTEQRDAVTLRLGKTQERMIDAERQRDRLAVALRECREDSLELLGERDWWQNETRLDYQKRYKETCDNVTRANEALQSLTPNAEP